jgi:hypothetical protein
VAEDARKASLGAMTNLMCRGRKRGLAGVIATQRLAKLAKNVAAEASNFLMGRTFLDIDMARAADLLGMERRQAEAIRELERGHFLALGPALSRRPIAIRIGEVETQARGGSPRLIPLPTTPGDEAEALLLDVSEPVTRVSPPPPPPVSASDLLGTMASRPLGLPAAASEPAPAPDAAEQAAAVDAVLRDIVADPDAAYRTASLLYQDFAVRCRMKGIGQAPLDLPLFTRRLAMARAGFFAADLADESWAEALRIAEALPDDMLGVFLLIARAARADAACPSDAEVALVYGTHSIGRAKRLLGYMETQGIFVPRTDLRGRRSICVAGLGWTTAPGEPATDSPGANARLATAGSSRRT